MEVSQPAIAQGLRTAGVATIEAPSAEKAVSGGRLGYVDGLRAVAALYVVASHCMSQIWPEDPTQGLAAVVAKPLEYSHFAVSAFIVLSGFSLMLPVARNGGKLPWSVWGFYLRRARRIVPPYYLAMGLTLVLIWLLIGQQTIGRYQISLPVTIPSVIEHILLVQDLSPQYSLTINFAFWSIAMECQIYLLFPALILFWRRYPPLLAAALVTALSLILVYALVFTWIAHIPGYTGTAFAPQYIGLFAMGMFGASVFTSQSPRWRWLCAHFLWEAVAVVCLVILTLMVTRWALFKLDLFAGIGTVGLLLASSRQGRFNPVRALLSWRPLVWVGGFSYSLYLIHAPLIQVIWQYALHPLGLGAIATFLPLLLGGSPLIVAAAWVFYRFCERPFLNSRPRASAAPVAVPAPDIAR